MCEIPNFECICVQSEIVQFHRSFRASAVVPLHFLVTFFVFSPVISR